MNYWYRTELDAPPKRPLLLYLHGWGESEGDDVAQTTKHGPWSDGEEVQNARVLRELRGFFRVGPHLPRKSEDWNSDMLRDLVQQIRRQHADVAPDRLFVVGISRGGKGALDFAAAHGKGLGIIGVVVCCPESVDNLKAALLNTPVYLFHGDGDTTVPLNAEREATYKNLRNKANFRWVRVHQDWTLGKTHHNCWTCLFGHPDLYGWFTRLTEVQYRKKKAVWPNFADLAAPARRRGENRRKAGRRSLCSQPRLKRAPKGGGRARVRTRGR